MTDKEQEAYDFILDAMGAIQNMDDRDRLKYNCDELAQAVHVLQSFVKQHVLHRLDPDNWLDWWSDADHN